MTTKIVPGSLVALPTADDVAKEAAGRIARTLGTVIADRGSASIALSGGSTPRATYAALAGHTVDWTKVRVFFVDERSVPADAERSNYRMIREALLDAAAVPVENVHRMAQESANLAAAARAYEDQIREHVRLRRDDVPSVDLVILGIGDDGHTASLFPGEPELDVSDRLVCAVPAKGEREARLSMTVPLLEAARATIVLAVGARKHEPLERVWNVRGSVRETPARIVRGFKGSVTWVIDRLAGGM